MADENPTSQGRPYGESGETSGYEAGERIPLGGCLKLLAYAAAFAAIWIGGSYALRIGPFKENKPDVVQPAGKKPSRTATNSQNLPCIIKITSGEKTQITYQIQAKELSDLLDNALAEPAEAKKNPYNIEFFSDPKAKTSTLDNDTKKLLSGIIRDSYTNDGIEAIRKKYVKGEHY